MNMSPTESNELMQAFLAMETLQSWQGHLIRKGMKLVERIERDARKNCQKHQPLTQKSPRKKIQKAARVGKK